MPKKEISEQVEAKTTEVETLRPFSVIIDGQDRTIFATDEEDLKARIAKIRGQ